MKKAAVSLFEAAGLADDAPRPLADRLRPASLAEVVGQDHLLGEQGMLSRMVKAGRLVSVIFWGPPGTGKTTVARLLAEVTDLHFEQLSAIHSGVADLRKVFEAARARREQGRGTLLFVDEIHRFNRSQQDAFLPYMEDGTIILVGATTENPSFELNSALLSRASVLTFKRLDDAAIEALLERAEKHERRKLPLTPDAREALIAMADGDGRGAINLAEDVFLAEASGAKTPLDREALVQLVQRRAPIYDKSQDGHYNLISALHKSVRGSDPDASLYWLARMLAGGEDPLYIARRLVRMAVEDIGLADPECAGAGQRRQGDLRFSWVARRRARAGASHDLSRHRAEIECRLCRVRRGEARGGGGRLALAAEAHPQRADQADEAGRLRPRLRLRP